MTNHDVPTSVDQDVAGDVRERFTAVSRNVSIYDVRMTSLEASLGELRKEVPQLHRLSRTHSVARNDETGEIRVDAVFAFDMAYDSEESKLNPPVGVRAVFTLSYKVTDLSSFDDDHIDSFAEVNGIYNAWPYWRELLQNTLCRMGLLSPILPVYRIVDRDQSVID